MFLFKKIAPLFFFPVPLCLELLLLGLALLWFTRRQRAGKILVSGGTILLLICSTYYVPSLALRPLEEMYSPIADSPIGETPVPEVNATQTAKWVVVLSGREWPLRVLEGVRLYKAGPGRKLILSGGAVYDKKAAPDSQIMANAARIMGVEPRDIIQESASRDTKDQARFIKRLVGSDGFFLVTSAYHMPRSMALFRKQGLAPIAAPSDYLGRDISDLAPPEFFPASQPLHLMETALHEYLGLAWARLRGEI
jgi:uncharacterized SAM-binding protein YcdF (DUF218 family)